MIKIKLRLFLSVLFMGTALFAERTVYHFDSPDDLKALNSKNVFFEKENTVAGSGAICFKDKTLADYDGKGLFCSFKIPSKTPEGVLTFWIYDPIFNLRRNDTRFNINIACSIKEGGKNKFAGYSFIDFRTRSGWLFGKGLFDLRETSAMRHQGWTRFDIINPPGDEPQQFIICVDGREVTKTYKRLSSIDGLSINAGTGFFFAPVLIDEVSYDTDPNSYRPNVIQKIICGGSEKSIELKQNEKLKVIVKLDKKGAKENSGKLTLRLMDGMEKDVLKKDITIDWEKQKNNELEIELPSPTRSGYYWLEASYKEDTWKLADFDRTRVDIQFLTTEFEKHQNYSITICTPWDFLPIDDEVPHKINRLANTVPDVPKKVPADWSMAVPLSGPWYCWGGETFRCMSTGFASWYRQVLEIPKSWKGRRILLDIDDPQTVAHVFINGKKVGVIENPGGNIDITSKAVAGGKIDVALFLVATGIYGKTKITKEILGKRYQIPAWASKLKQRGLMGDVSLVSEPMKTRLESVVIRTYVEDKKLWLGFNCENLEPGKTYKIKSEVSIAGKVAKKIPELSFKAKLQKQQVNISVPWKSPRLWNIGNPYLYDFNAKLLNNNGQIVNSIYPVRFGFREILFKDRIVTINGKPINFFHPLSGGYAINNFGYRNFMTQQGLNGLQKIKTISARNAKFFDEAGLGLRYKAGDGFRDQQYIPILAKYGKEKDTRFWDAYQKDIEYLVKKHINNPSVLFWRGEKFSNKTGLEMNPLLQDGIWKKKASNDQEERMMEVGKRTGNIIRSLDPTRYQSTMVSHSFNDTIDINYYTGFNPIQELIERNEYWRKYGKKPYFVDEYASPYQTDWCNSPWEGGGGHRSPRKVPQIAEWLAVTKGDQAFVRGELENVALKAFETQSLKDLDKATKIKDPRKRKIAIGKRAINGFKKVCAVYSFNYGNARDKLVEERLKEHVYNWRADGVGMMCYFGGGQLRDLSMSQFYQPIAAFIAGTAKKRTAKDHIFAPGETLQRSVIILNNERESVEVRCDWKLTLNGKVVEKKSEKVSVSAGGQVTLPIKIKIPEGSDRSGVLSMVLYAQNGLNSGTLNFKKDEKISEDSCSVNIIAPRKQKQHGKIAVIDPEGDSTLALEKIGVKFDKLHFNSDLKEYGTIIFGRRAFSYELQILEAGLSLASLTAQGKNIIILEQSEKILRDRFKFRTEYTSARNVFSRYGAGILFDGLPGSCLKYWRGASTLTDGYKIARESLQPEDKYRDGAWYPYIGNDGKEKNRIVKWGNTHNVATVLIIKPDTGNFRTLVDCGFSLNYAGTLELLNTNGRVIFNQLDVSGRTEEDPAANRFLANLLRYAENSPKPQWRKAVYLGGDKNADLLSFLRIDFQRLKNPSEAKHDEVMILGDADLTTLLSWEQAIKTFVKDGGIVFCMPKETNIFSSTFFPFKVKATKNKVNNSVISKSQDKLLAGLGNSDFYWKGDIEIVALEQVDGASLKLESGVLARVPYGKGEYVLCQIAPDMFDVNKRFWLKNSKRNNERLIINLLSNLEVEMKAPYFMKAVGAKIKLASSIALTGKWSVCPGRSNDMKCPAKKNKNGRAINLPGNFQKQIPDMAKRKGFVWFRRKFNIVGQIENAKFAEIDIGQIGGCDRTYINGEIVGESNMNTHVNDVGIAFRKYKIPLKLLKQGNNQIDIRVEFNVDALLGMSNTTGEIFPPMMLNFYAEKDELGNNFPPINLEEKWRGIAIGKETKPCPSDNDKNWHTLIVPAAYERQHPAWEVYNGYFWYSKTFKIKKKLSANAEPFLLLGGVDDWDTTYINGTEIGHTTPQNFFKMASAYNTPRKYAVPPKLLKVGENKITILVHDPQNDGGITFGPVKLVFADPVKVEQNTLLNTNYLILSSEDPDAYVARHW